MEQLLKALSDSNIVAFYYDTNPSFVEFKKAVKAAIYANRLKHSMWDCYGDGDPKHYKKLQRNVFSSQRYGSECKLFLEWSNSVADANADCK